MLTQLDYFLFSNLHNICVLLVSKIQHPAILVFHSVIYMIIVVCIVSTLLIRIIACSAIEKNQSNIYSKIQAHSALPNIQFYVRSDTLRLLLSEYTWNALQSAYIAKQQLLKGVGW